MKIYSVKIESIIMDKNGDKFVKTNTQAYVPANSRGEAIAVACDMGQAMARSTNAASGKVAMYFRVLGVEETEQSIAC